MNNDRQTATDLDTLAFATADLTNTVMVHHLAARGLFDRDSRPDLVDATARLGDAVQAMQQASELLLGMVALGLPGNDDDETMGTVTELDPDEPSAPTDTDSEVPTPLDGRPDS